MRRRAVQLNWDRPLLRLYVVADTHVGAEACDERKIEALAQRIANDDDALVVGLGDYIEAITIGDYRFDPAELAKPIAPEHLSNPLYCQALRFCKLWEPTRGKWACVIMGNHERTALSHVHFDATALIAERMGTKYHGGTDEGGWLQIRLMQGDKVRYRLAVYMQHGWGGGALRGGDALKLQRLAKDKDADIVLMAHCHRPDAFPEPVEGIDRNGWECTKSVWGVIAFPMIAKHGYIARRGGNAPPAGYAVVTVERQHDGAPLIGAELKTL